MKRIAPSVKEFQRVDQELQIVAKQMNQIWESVGRGLNVPQLDAYLYAAAAIKRLRNKLDDKCYDEHNEGCLHLDNPCGEIPR